MSDLKLDPTTNDIALENGDLAIVGDSDAVAQHIRQRLKFFRGEWFLDTSAGVPYYQDILKKNPNPEVVEQLLRNEILGTPGVLELQKFEMDFQGATRSLRVSFQVRTVDGPVVFTEDLGV